MFTASYVILTTIAMVVSAYLSFRNNGNPSRFWFFFAWAWSVIPLWTIISRHSKNLLADAAIYDATVAVVYYLALIWFTGQFGTIRWWQALGFALTVVGAVLVKVK